MEEEQIKDESADSPEKKIETTDMIQRAEDAAKRLEEANKEKEKLLDRQEVMLSREILGGRSEGGAGTIKTLERTNEEIANAVLEGKEANPFLKTDKYA